MYEDVLLVEAPVVRGHKAVTVAMTGQHARNQSFPAGEGVAPSFDSVDDLLGIQLVQVMLKVPAGLRCPDPETARGRGR